MRRGPALFASMLLLAGCAATEERRPGPGDAGPPAPWFAFSLPLNLTPGPDGAGSEPGILATRAGTLFIVSVLGSATARGDGLHRSTDGGQTWQFLGKPDHPFGGGDADLDEDEAGRIYLPGQWRPAAIPGYYVTGGESMATSTDGGETWVVNPGASNLPVTDRQWTATYGAGTAWLAFNQAQRGLVVTKSTDGGVTWTFQRSLDGTWDQGDGVAGGPNGIPGDIVADPRDGTLFLPYGPGIGGGSRQHRLFVSTDGGANYEMRVAHTAPEGEQGGAIFGSLALDTEGRLYYAWAESLDGGEQGVRVYLRTSADRGATWSPPQSVSPPGMTAVFPWVVAGSPGRVAVSFYAAAGHFLSDEASANVTWHPVVALSRDALGPNASFDYVPLSPWPNHKGPLCTGGTGCDGQFRLLGDFFEIALTREGRVVAVWVDDTTPVRVNVFAQMTQGSLLEPPPGGTNS